MAGQPLKGKHYFHAPINANGVMVATLWHPLQNAVGVVPVGTPTIYIRQMQAYAFGANRPDPNLAWISIQPNAASTVDMVGICCHFLGKGKTVETRYFQPDAIELLPTDKLLIEVYAQPGSPYHGDTPVFDVMWTDAP